MSRLSPQFGCQKTDATVHLCRLTSPLRSSSPTDKQPDVTEKAFAYLNMGTRLVWVIEPIAKTVRGYRSETDFTLLIYLDTLTGEDVVEGFVCPVAQLFE